MTMDNTVNASEKTEMQKVQRAGERANALQDFLRASHRVGKVALTACAVSAIIPGAQHLLPATLGMYATTGMLQGGVRFTARQAYERAARRRAAQDRFMLAVAYQSMALVPATARIGTGAGPYRILLTALSYASRADSPYALGGITHETAGVMEQLSRRQSGRIRKAATKLSAQLLANPDAITRAQWRLALWNATARVSEDLASDGDRTAQYHGACVEAMDALSVVYQQHGADAADAAARALHCAFPESNVMALYADVLAKSDDVRATHLSIFANDSDPAKICAWVLIGGERAEAPAPGFYERMQGAVALGLSDRGSNT